MDRGPEIFLAQLRAVEGCACEAGPYGENFELLEKYYWEIWTRASRRCGRTRRREEDQELVLTVETGRGSLQQPQRGDWLLPKGRYTLGLILSMDDDILLLFWSVDWWKERWNETVSQCEMSRT